MWGKEVYMGWFGVVGLEGVDLLVKMLVLDLKKRIMVREMLEYRWWRMELKLMRKEDLLRKSGGGEEKMGVDLKRRNGVLEGEDRGSKVVRKLDFGVMK